MTGLTVLGRGWGVVPIEADAIGTTNTEEVNCVVEQSVSSDVAGEALGHIGAGVAGLLTSLTGLILTIVPVHHITFAKIVARVRYSAYS